ncbi:unnamed protein product [Lupinus luteus]|uniref:Uncharacterized protein n=1 Tax=Lupinus luteus TaxID=3873 RepID=A0AAV1W338_LUPLU
MICLMIYATPIVISIEHFVPESQILIMRSFKWMPFVMHNSGGRRQGSWKTDTFGFYHFGYHNICGSDDRCHQSCQVCFR